MNMKKQSKHILILGGMGPQASIYAHTLLLKAATSNGATNNEDYPRVTHLSVNVKDFISTPEHKLEACDYLIRCLKELDLTSVDDAFIACNTAHVLQAELERATGIKFTSLVETAVAAVTSDKNISKVGVLATPSTLKTGLYSHRLHGITDFIGPSVESSEKLEMIIRDVIGGKDIPPLVNRLKLEIDELLQRGAQKVILGCTELSLLGEYLDGAIVVDPLSLTVEKVLCDERR